MRRLALLSTLALVAIGGCHKQAAEAPQASPPADTAPAAPATAAHTIDTANAGKSLAAATIQGPDGKLLKLSDLKGKPVLVNLWATWCVPCVKELPTLDALVAAKPGLQVVAVSEDMEGQRVVAPFLAKHKLATLKPYSDPTNALLLQTKEAGLPVSILYGADGKEAWRVRGDVEWTGAKAKEWLAQGGVS